MSGGHRWHSLARSTGRWSTRRTPLFFFKTISPDRYAASFDFFFFKTFLPDHYAASLDIFI